MNINSLKILSVLPVLGHPRDSKRIAMLQQAGFAVEAVAFEREYHTGRMPDCPVERLGKIANVRYVRRILKQLLTLPAMRRAIRRNHIVYASGPDVAYMALIASLGLGKPVVLEVGDIRELQVAPGWKGLLVRTIDKYFVNACSLLIATAPGFVDYYYRKWLKSSIPAIVIENKLESSFAKAVVSKDKKNTQNMKPLIGRPLRIGYFGGLRCEWSLHVLEALAISRPHDIEIVLAGYPMFLFDLQERIKNYTNVKYLGQYNSPQDLPSLYNNVDLIWACYKPIEQNDWNLRWARPNRFYESCFFQKPIISRYGSSDSIEVFRYDIGVIIKDHEVDKVVEKLIGINSDDLRRWERNMSMIPTSVYIYTTEMDELARVLKGLVTRTEGNL